MSNASAVSAASRARLNGTRLEELKARLERLARREPVTPLDVERAHMRARAQLASLEVARDRLSVTRRSAAARHESYAELLLRMGRVESAHRERDAARHEYALMERGLEETRQMASAVVAPADGGELARLRDGLAALLAWSGRADLDEVDRRQAWCRSIVERCAEREWRGWLDAVCHTGAAVLTSVRGVAVTVASAAGVEFAAASDDWTTTVHQLELVVGEGPSTSARAGDRIVAVDDLRAEREAWQCYASAIAEHRVRGVCAMPLRLRGASVGALTLYYYVPLAESPAADLADAEAFADIASAAVLADIDQIRHGGPADHSLFIVHVAAGAMMSRLDIGPEEADARLRAYAFGAGERLEEVARRVLAGEDIP